MLNRHHSMSMFNTKSASTVVAVLFRGPWRCPSCCAGVETLLCRRCSRVSARARAVAQRLRLEMFWRSEAANCRSGDARSAARWYWVSRVAIYGSERASQRFTLHAAVSAGWSARLCWERVNGVAVIYLKLVQARENVFDNQQ